MRITVVGAGPAGFAVSSAFLTESTLDVDINLVDRTERPDRLLRHGPAVGAKRLKSVAKKVDSVLSDDRVTYWGSLELGATLPLDEVRSASDAVVLAIGAPLDLPLEIAGADSVGIGTISHFAAWLAGSPDTAVDELDLAMDTAVLIGYSSETLGVAEILCGAKPPAGCSRHAADRLRDSSIRHVQIVDTRSTSEIVRPPRAPANLTIRDSLTPVGIVGRNRARALRCLGRADSHGRLVSEDLRAQLLLRPRARSVQWCGLDEQNGHIAGVDGRVLGGGSPIPGVYAAGWAARAPWDQGSHAADAAAVVAALRADRGSLPRARITLADVLAQSASPTSSMEGWSAVAATDALLQRFTGEGTLPLADYDALMNQVDED